MVYLSLAKEEAQTNGLLLDLDRLLGRFRGCNGDGGGSLSTELAECGDVPGELLSTPIADDHRDDDDTDGVLAIAEHVLQIVDGLHPQQLAEVLWFSDFLCNAHEIALE